MYLFMSFSEIQILKGRALLQQLIWACLSFVSRALEVVLLMEAYGGGEKVVHHHDTNVHTPTL